MTRISRAQEKSRGCERSCRRTGIPGFEDRSGFDFSPLGPRDEFEKADPDAQHDLYRQIVERPWSGTGSDTSLLGLREPGRLLWRWRPSARSVPLRDQQRPTGDGIAGPRPPTRR